MFIIDELYIVISKSITCNLKFVRQLINQIPRSFSGLAGNKLWHVDTTSFFHGRDFGRPVTCEYDSIVFREIGRI